MDVATLLAALDFSRARLLGTLDAIEKSGPDTGKVLGWRPGPGRAHIAWQAMHCAATLDRYLNVRLKGGKEKDEDLVANFAGGSTPSDSNIPTVGEIRTKLEQTYRPFRDYVASITPQELTRQISGPGGAMRSVADSIILMAWHDAHHQGQMHLTWNMYKQAHGVK